MNFEKELTAAMNLIYKIRVDVNKKKINFDKLELLIFMLILKKLKKI